MQDVQELLKGLFKGTVEEMLEAEMDEHLGYDKHSPMGDLSGNREMATIKRRFKHKWARLKLGYPGTETENLSHN